MRTPTHTSDSDTPAAMSGRNERALVAASRGFLLAILLFVPLGSSAPSAQTRGEVDAIIAESGISDEKAEILHLSRIPLPYIDDEILAAKVWDTENKVVVPVYLDWSLRPVDLREAQQAELAEYNAIHGKYHHLLTELLDTAQLDSRIPVAIWLTSPDTSPAEAQVRAFGFQLSDGKPVGPDAKAGRSQLIAEKRLIYSAYNAPIASAIQGMGGQIDVTSELAPLVFATLTPDQIWRASNLPAVQRIYTVPVLKKHMLSANAAVQNAAMKAAGHTGAGVKVAIVDFGHPVYFGNTYLDHLGGATFRVVGDFYDEHATDTAGCVGALQQGGVDPAYPVPAGPPPDDGADDGIAPDVDMLSANPVNGAMSNIVLAIEWAIGLDAEILNISIGGAGVPPTIGPFDKYVDHIVFEHFIAVSVAAGNACTPDAIIEPAAGGNGTADTTVAVGTDDVQVIAPGAPAAPGATIIGPGGNGRVDTPPAGDDEYWDAEDQVCQVGSPGLAYNCITVGAIDDMNTFALPDDIRAYYSSWVDIAGDHEKPEVSAPGSRILTTAAADAIVEPAAGGNGTADTTAAGDDDQVIAPGAPAAPGAVIVHFGPNDDEVWQTTPGGDDEFRFDADGIRDVETQGTSFAAPIVSGFVANMIDMDATLSPWPETTKAIAIASAKRNVYDNPIEPPALPAEVDWDPREGAGTIWIDEGKDIIDKGHYDKTVVGESYFPFNRLVGVKAGEQFRYAIAWSTHTSGGTHDNITNDVLTADLDLYVYDKNDNLVTWSDTFDNAYEVVGFEAPADAVYRVEIQAFRFDDSFEYLGQAWNAECQALPAPTIQETGLIVLAFLVLALGAAGLHWRRMLAARRALS